MNINGKITIFAEHKTKGQETFVICSTSISSKREDGTYLNKTVEVRFAKEVADKTKLAKLEDDYCYQVEVNDGFLTCDSYTNKDGKEVRFLVIFITKGKLTGRAKVEKPEKPAEVNNDDLPF